MKITWIGHSCFRVETKAGTVIFDPYQDGSVPGYSDVREEADLVICSHGHGDHNAEENVRISEGAAAKTAQLKVTQLETYHDETKGSQRGRNVITVIDDGEKKLAHFGDLGCDLTEAEKEVLTGLDAVLIPVGGYYTIDGKKAAQIVTELKPKLAVPMHFSNAEKGLGYPVITSEEVFLEELKKLGYEGEISRLQACSVSTDEQGVVVLQAKNTP